MFNPHVIIAASKGYVYLQQLWRTAAPSSSFYRALQSSANMRPSTSDVVEKSLDDAISEMLHTCRHRPETQC
eukprot:2807070-Amphidinium_carterae.1